MLFNSFKDKELADHCVRAWNDFILEEWCPGGPPGLFVPMIICQVWDPVLAAAEVRRGADKGARALCFVENPVPDGLPGFHTDHWDQLWDAVQETEMPVCLHIGSSGYIPMPDPSAPLSSTITLANVGGILSIVNLLLSPVCYKFPDIKIVFSEAGIGWIPAVLERADRQLDRHQYWSGRQGALTPTEIFRRNMYVCMVEEPIGLTFHGIIGADRILAETDYPHSDSLYPRVQESYQQVFDGIPEDVVTAVSHGNAEKLFRWEMADPALLTSPEVAEWRATLDSDPYAAKQRRHANGAVEREAAPDRVSDGRCGHLVLSGSNYGRCDKPVGDDGICEDGHHTGPTADAVPATSWVEAAN
jgi:predicted TIM-barrel fold metal-dependent hydrolase